MKKSCILINIKYNLFEKLLVRFSNPLMPILERNISFILVNSLHFFYKDAIKSNSQNLWSQLLILKYYLFEEKLVEKWVNEFIDVLPDSKNGEKVLIQGPNLDYSKLVDKNFDRVIILKPNNFHYNSKVTLLNNHISSYLSENVDYEKFHFKFKAIGKFDIEYPAGTNNSFSLMGLQRAVYFCLKELCFSEIHIKGFDLYAHSTYNRKLYPTLISKDKEQDTLGFSFYRHGLVGNYLFMKKLSQYFEIDSNVLTTTTREYLQNVWNNLNSHG